MDTSVIENHQLCEVTELRLDDLPSTMVNRDGQWESDKGIYAVNMSWW